jgi:lysophospholipase L1-like esterase
MMAGGGRKALLVSVAIAAVVILTFGWWITRSPEPPKSPETDPPEALRLVALGDSYMSGEGARQFFAGSDDPRRNKCRRAPTAYPNIVVERLGLGLTFAACSGAYTHHILHTDQYPDSSQGVLGDDPQLRVLADTERVDVILLSIGGNDAGFGDLGKGCASPLKRDCRNRADEWVRQMDEKVYPALVETYREVRNAGRGAEVFVMTYPDPLGEADCPELPLNRAEFGFVKETFLPRLNQLVRFAALVSSVRVIDIENAFVGYRICEVPPGRAAANILGFGRSAGNGIDIKNWGHNSFHPNERGHSLIAGRVESTLRAWLGGRLEPLDPPPPPGIPPEPFVPHEISVPIGPYPFPRGTACDGDAIATIIPVAVGTDAPNRVPIRLNDVAPSSTICFRDYKGKWRSTRASPDGFAIVHARVDRPGIGSINEILHRTVQDTWVKVFVQKLRVEAPA